jgi:CubicO group peptidase (beta-lactamase class C family)
MKMTGRRFSYSLFLFIFLLSGCKKEQVITSLPRSIPEAEGVSSQGIIDFLDAAAKSSHEFHSMMFLRHGKVIAEGWWNPYKPELRHTLYSTSKSFTATAVGFAVSEKRLSVNDKVISFFPDALPDTVSPFLSEMKVRDLLSMSAGLDPDPTFTTVVNDTNWVKAFLKKHVVHEPGTKFLYNTLATYMLSAIVQKVTGEKVIDFLKPRLFEPLAIEGMDWEVDPRGINTGGWGLRLKTEDMAKFFCRKESGTVTRCCRPHGLMKPLHLKFTRRQMLLSQRRIPATGCRDIVTRCGAAGIIVSELMAHTVNILL